MTKCECCDYPLDKRGRCASCFGVDPQSLEGLKNQTARWAVCPDHGAFEREGRGYRHSWIDRDPKDKRKKREHSFWTAHCPKCPPFSHNKVALPFSESVPRRKEAYQPEIEERLARWNKNV